MADPVLRNKAASIVNGIIKDLTEGAGASAVEASLIANYPFLGVPFVKQTLEFILGEVARGVYIQVATAATKIIIDLQVNAETSTVTSSFRNLQMALASGDQNAINMASADLSKAYSDLVHSDGAAPP